MTPIAPQTDVPRLLALGARRPEIDPEAWIAPGATVAGSVRIAARASLWYGVVARGDAEQITIGAGSNLQDGCLLHADPGFSLTIGAGVSVGHGAVLHGATIEDDVLVGMGSIVMNGAVIGAGSIVGAGACVTEGTVVPPRSMVLGVPGKVRAELSDEQVDGIRLNAEHYVHLAATHRDATPL
ncbi:gamma carbonic anhydrase family protein [Nocardioides sambongensis]|uniref:gamma carbonic anhydrase family protein n=1 Tax=Nocardioides sambongensis TaxID=2589074 RepID=UPI00112DAB82|nr:gamma carbonic anhydrase family protein [Nocardioides sambongensis]